MLVQLYSNFLFFILAHLVCESKVALLYKPSILKYIKQYTQKISTKNILNLVLLGMAGTGKSASGNTILGQKHFVSRPSSTAVTTICQNVQTEISGVDVNVIDTPDMFDDDIAPSVRGKHVQRCKQLCESGPCVYVLVMHVSRFIDDERDIMEKLEKAFGREVRGRTIILFTRGNDLQQAGMGLKDFLHSCQPDLKKMVEKCGNRCVLFENNKSVFLCQIWRLSFRLVQTDISWKFIIQNYVDVSEIHYRNTYNTTLPYRKAYQQQSEPCSPGNVWDWKECEWKHHPWKASLLL
uniref:AIG1-type G domain-containing protein n=1 Tax=Maylandia zebra TaxID=106582 RepID=A0A3P9CZP0_9CICH